MIYAEECDMTLADRQALPLETKLVMTQHRIREWVKHWGLENVRVMFSGGKDSALLLHICQELFPGINFTFIDTGLEFPEIRSFALSKPGVTSIKPSMGFYATIKKYGYPVVTKKQAAAIRKLTTQNLSPRYRNYLLHGDERGNMGSLSAKWHYLLDAPFKISEKCCDVMKKRPANKLEGKPITGQMAYESVHRARLNKKHGCNMYDLAKPISNPLAFWTEDDVWEFIKQNNIPVSEVYSMGYKRTGCVFCMFGAHLEGTPNRFQRLKQTHPKLWTYCMDKLDLRTVTKYLRLPVE